MKYSDDMVSKIRKPFKSILNEKPSLETENNSNLTKGPSLIHLTIKQEIKNDTKTRAKLQGCNLKRISELNSDTEEKMPKNEPKNKKEIFGDILENIQFKEAKIET